MTTPTDTERALLARVLAEVRALATRYARSAMAFERDAEAAGQATGPGAVVDAARCQRGADVCAAVVADLAAMADRLDPRPGAGSRWTVESLTRDASARQGGDQCDLHPPRHRGCAVIEADLLREAAALVRERPPGLRSNPYGPMDISDIPSPLVEPLAVLLDGLEGDAEEIGPDHRSVTVARVLLGRPALTGEPMGTEPTVGQLGLCGPDPGAARWSP